MRFAVLIACVVAVASAQFQGQYFPQQGLSNQYRKSNGQYNAYNKPAYKPFVTSTPYPYRPSVSVTELPAVFKVAPVPVVPVARVAADARSAETLKYRNEIEADGTYNYSYETNNGIAAQAQGVPRVFSGNPPVAPAVAQGSFSWTSPEGTVIEIGYVADENGYQPQGNAIPTPPEVPAQIARALAYTANFVSKTRN